MNIDDFEDDDDASYGGGSYSYSYTPKKKLKPITLGFDADKLNRLKDLAESKELRERLAKENRPGFNRWGMKGYADLLRFAADDFIEKYEPKKKETKAAPAKKSAKKSARTSSVRTRSSSSSVRTSSPAKKKVAKKVAKKTAKRRRS